MFPLETNTSHTRPHLLLLELVASHLGHRESPARPVASGARRSPPQTRPLAPPQWMEASWSTLDTFRGYRGTSDWINVKVSCGCRLTCGARSQTTRAAMQKIGLRSAARVMDSSSQIFKDEWRWLLWSWASNVRTSEVQLLLFCYLKGPFRKISSSKRA